jgi:hypothetical protein
MTEVLERLKLFVGQDRWGRVSEIPLWLVVLVSVVLLAIATFLFIASDDLITAGFGLLSALLGGLIAAITNLSLTERQARSQMAMVTWPERVRTHQEAYALWQDILQVIYEENRETRASVFDRAAEWYKCHCLYLSEQARDDFRRMYYAAHMHKQLVDGGRGIGDDRTAKNIQENWSKIMALVRVLIEGSGGHISDEVLKELRRQREESAKGAGDTIHR